MTGVLRLRGAVRHYEWGGYDLIPGLLGVANRERRPYAELWIGTHHVAPCSAEVDGAVVPLAKLSRLPYLLKVLDAREMLSIQAHPSKAQAEAGYVREEAAGVPLDAPHRNYRDANHKPEVHAALTELRMLHGFRPMAEITAALLGVPELRGIECGESLRGLYEWLMTMPQERVDAILAPLVERLERESPSDKDTREYWALRAAREFPPATGRFDRGIFSIYLLNLVRLRPGQGTFQPAGVLHAYLEGANVELMADSDNVLRGGLTRKHVDVPELLGTLSFESGAPRVLEPEPVSASESVYRTPEAGFELSRIVLPPGGLYEGLAAPGPDSLIVLEGTVASADLRFARGGILFAPCGSNYTLQAGGEGAVLYRASVPSRKGL
jgi:mannose-6-phosphate isomerase